MRRRGTAGAAGLALLLGGAAAGDAAAKRAKPERLPGPAISVLSNRADLISGGDALVAITAPKGVKPSKLRVRLERRVRSTSRGRARTRLRTRSVTSAFRVRSGGRLEGGGPVFSGPQLRPWKCQKTAIDSLCNQPAEFTYLYKSTSPAAGGLQRYDPKDPPGDVATTTTDEGVRVPFVVRLETGYQDRDQYKIMTLRRPGEPWDRWAPPKQWNRKVVITHGGSCGVDYEPGEAPVNDYSGTVPVPLPVYDDSYIVALSRGFAVLSTALDDNGHNCNIALQAESLTMAKEHLVENYGDVRYTIGSGCSGGALVQLQLANAYPGIYQGAVVGCTYPDTLTAGAQFADYHLLREYFENPDRWGPGVSWSPDQWAAVEGHLSHANAIVADEGLFKRAIVPTHPCGGIADRERYHPATNPAGVRCSVLDAMINVLGPRPPEVWTAIERKLGHGFAGQPLGNAGIQYGLEALRQGDITPAQFVDVNARIGGLEIDTEPIAERTQGDDRAIANAYRSGAINEANNLAGIAIINHSGPDPAIAHDYSHALWVRDRIEREHGHHRNHVMWFGHAPVIGDVGYARQALIAMDRWLAAVEKDGRAVTLARKVADDRPADIQDRCSQLPGVELVQLPTGGKACEVAVVQTNLGTPRTVAGGPVANDVNKCRLKALRRDDYPVELTEDQWSQLEQAFPAGVCDWSKPGVGQQPSVTWQTYQARNGRVIYGGRPLARARTAAGWASEAFRR